MKSRIALFASAGFATVAAFSALPAFADDTRPNFLVIIADDLGYSDIGAFGGEIETPNLDALAEKGVRLTGFHTAPTSSPTRAQLLTGSDNHLVGLGTMAELIAPNQRGVDGFEGYLRKDTVTLAEALSAGGYETILSGKWHLGVAPEQDPHNRGFQKSFALLQGGHNHFGDQTVWKSSYRENGKDVGLPSNFYSTDFFTDKLIQYLDEKKANDDNNKDNQKPFFAYLAYTAPHWPLQAPPELIAKYRGKYDKGPEALREQRIQKQKQLGLVTQNAKQHDLVFPNGKKWNDLSDYEKKQYIASQETLAAMVDRLDQNVGRVIADLKKNGQYDNTVIVFLADNGAEGFDAIHNGLPVPGAKLPPVDNSPENIGNANSFAAIGPLFAQASTIPSYLYKAFASEGGTRTAAFISYKGFKRENEIDNYFASVQDILPTFLDLAHIKKPEGEFNGHKIQPIRGKSWVNYLNGKEKTVYSQNYAFGTELFGSRSLRKGDWKILGERSDSKWKLFNIANDPGETEDLSNKFPDKFKELVKDWEDYAKNNNIVIPDKSYFNP